MPLRSMMLPARMGRAPLSLVAVGLTTAVLVTSLVGTAGAYVRPATVRQVTVGWDGGPPSYPDVPCKSGNLCTYYLGHRTSLSRDGFLVAFESYATDLVRDDNNGVLDVFVRDLRTARTVRASVSSTGQEAVGLASGNLTSVGLWNLSSHPSLSANGRYLAFDSEAPNMVSGDTNVGRDVFVRDLVKGTTVRVSVNSRGEEADYPEGLGFTGSQSPAISGTGRYIAFRSSATNLVKGDTNEADDIFLHDTRTGETQRVSVSSRGEEADNASYDDPSISTDGQSVAFTSPATNLVADDGNQQVDVFVRDVDTGKTELVSVSSSGEGANLGSQLHESNHAISRNGRYVVFPSQSSNLVPNDSNLDCALPCNDVFVRDRKARRTHRVSVTSAGAEVEDGGSGISNVGISDNGRFIVFHSYSSSLAGDMDAAEGCDEFGNPRSCDSDVILHDLKTGSTEWVSSTARGEDATCEEAPSGAFGVATAPFLSANGCGSGDASVTPKGDYVAFYSRFSDLVEGDENDYADVFVRHRGREQGVGEPRPIRMRSAPSLGSLGFVSTKDAVGESARRGWSDGSDIVSASVAVRPRTRDVYLELEVDGMPGIHGGVAGVSASGDPTVLYGFRFRSAGVRYEVRAQRVVAGARASGEPGFGLFRCDPEGTCSRAADVEGGYGTTGEAVTFVVPVSQIGLRDGGLLSEVRGFTAVGRYDVGSLLPLDEVRLGGERAS